MGRPIVKQPQADALARDVVARYLRRRCRVVQNAAVIVKQQWILALLLREDPLGQSGHEHHVEDTSPDVFWGPDEDTSIPLRRRLFLELGETFGQHVLYFCERNRADPGHRSELAEHRQNPVRPLEHHRDQRLESVEPLAPGGLTREPTKSVDDRQGESAQVAQIDQIALEPAYPRGVGILSLLRLEAKLQFPLEPGQPSSPTVVPADDGRFDEQTVPAPWGTEGPIDHRLLVAILDRVGCGGGQRLRLREIEQRRLFRPHPSREELVTVVGRHPSPAVKRRGPGGVERQVLRKPPRGQSLGRASQ